MAEPHDVDIAKKRLKLIQDIAGSGNVHATCQKLGMSRSQYYEYKRRYELHGLEGLINRSSAHHTHPSTTAPEIEKQIAETSLEHPVWGSNKLCDHLQKKGIGTSAFTIHRILKRNKLGNRDERYLYFERKFSQENIYLTDEQQAFLEKFNPAYREWYMAPDFSGYLLYQDIILMGRLNNYTKVYMHTVIDSYSSFVFCLLRSNSNPEGAVTILEQITIPFFIANGCNVREIAIGSRKTFERGPTYRICLERNQIFLYPNTDLGKLGAIERFKQTVNKEFFRPALLSAEYDSLVSLQDALNSWLHSYNYERPSLGYPNFGKRPIERM